MSFSTPRAPDPYATAQAQSQANSEAIQQAAQYNQINQISPFGSQTYSGTLGSPDRTVTTTLTPELQNLVNSQMRISQGLANQSETRLGQIPNTPFSLEGLTQIRQAQGGNIQNDFNSGNQLQQMFSAGPQIQTNFNSGGPLQQTFDQGPQLQTDFNSGGPLQERIGDAGSIQRAIADQGPIQRGVSLEGLSALPGVGDFSADRQRVENALYQRATAQMDPRFAQDRSSLETQLANQGITQGSEAYRQAIGNFEDTRNRAYSEAGNNAILAGGDEQSRLFGMGLQSRQQGVGERFQQGDFANTAQNQAFGQALQAGVFGNQAQQQQFQQMKDDAQFYNAAQAQGYAQNMGQQQFRNDVAAQQYAQNQGAADFYNRVQNQGYNQNLGQQQFVNQAQQQQFNQNQNQAQFYNQVQNQGYNQNLGQQQFRNQAQQQQFDQGQALQASDMNLRNQQINEQQLSRNQAFNELAAFLGGSPQFQMPNFGTQAQYSPMGVPIGDYINQNYQTRMGAQGNTLGSLASLGGNAMMAYALMCWVAREVFRNDKWLKMREWMLRKAPDSLFKFYMAHGPAIAEYIKDKPALRSELRVSMEAIIG